MARKQTTKKKQKEKRIVEQGVAYIHSSFNNTIITITDPQGNVLCWSSSGAVNFKGSRKGTPFAAQVAAESAAKKALTNGMHQIDVNISGPGSGRETAVRSLQAAGLTVKTIKDITPLPHNGCKPPKRRRT